MDIILVSGKLAKAKTITISLPQIALFTFAILATIAILTTALNFAMLRRAADMNVPYVHRLLASLHQEQAARNESYLRENLNAMALRLGQMQAQLLRLDTLGERLAKLAGFRPQELMFGQTPGQGGALSSLPSQDLSFGDLTQQLDLLTRQVDDRGDKLGVLESLFTLDNARKKFVPPVLPVEAAWHSSDFGWRIDPFSGQRAFHEGVDFVAEQGTAVRAAAGGVVVYSEFHPQYGNMIEIDHGNDLVSRYAHAYKRLVSAGDVVLSGAKIAEVGRTGRATGTHLHFEVRHRGVSQNPTRFLRRPG
ncbi:MAG TPA: M23 family metallopeptidase [Burkholderiales bacterium]|nr:M23 family metallopeptidase [Burkholderiales bacterium]